MPSCSAIFPGAQPMSVASLADAPGILGSRWRTFRSGTTLTTPRPSRFSYASSRRAPQGLVAISVPDLAQCLLRGVAKGVVLVAALRERRDAAWQRAHLP